MSDVFDLPGGPAFPINIAGCGCPGMSLRDWFAGLAIATMINKCEDRYGGWSEDTVAAGCYALADAMLRARAVPFHADELETNASNAAPA